MLHQLIRYRPVLDILACGTYARVLEVGSGSGGIARFMDVKAVGVDMDFMDYSGERQECPANLSPVMAAAERLPFRDGSFDLVFSCDMLEHIPPDGRAAVIVEMVRVSAGKVVLVFPCGEAAAALDGILRSACILLKKPVPGWLEEHVGLELPTRCEAKSLVTGTGLTCKIRGNAFLPLHYITLVMESNRHFRERLSRISYAYGRDGSHGAVERFCKLLVSLIMAVADIWPTYRVAVEMDKPAGA